MLDHAVNTVYKTVNDINVNNAHETVNDINCQKRIRLVDSPSAIVLPVR